MTELEPPFVPADDRGLGYGDGLFETLRVAPNGAVPLFERHLARLRLGARRLDLPFDEDAFLHAVNGAATAGAGVVRVTLTAGSGGRGYARPVRVRPRLLLRRSALPVLPADVRTRGLVLGLCRTPLTRSPRLGGLKHLNRLDQVLAREEVRRAGWDEGLMLDDRQRPRDLTAMNLFARFGDRLWTPPCDDAGVAGVARGWCLEQAVAAGLTVEVGHRPLRRLREADEVFACNGVAGVVPVRKLAVWTWSAGELARRLGHAFEELFALS